MNGLLTGAIVGQKFPKHAGLRQCRSLNGHRAAVAFDEEGAAPTIGKFEGENIVG